MCVHLQVYVPMDVHVLVCEYVHVWDMSRIGVSHTSTFYIEYSVVKKLLSSQRNPFCNELFSACIQIWELDKTFFEISNH